MSLTKRACFFFVILWLACCQNIATGVTTIANDPTQMSVGARVLGMGRAFTAIADDTSAIFINPSGLGKIDNLQLSSMSSKYLSEFDYVQASALYPTPYGTFGIGYGGSSLNYVSSSSEIISVGGEDRVSATGEVRGTYSDTAVVLAYGNRVKLLKIDNLYLGASLKFISQGLSVIGQSSGTATGASLSFGALLPVRKDFSLGLSLQNALLNQVTWSTNSGETLPNILKIGAAYNLFGKNGSIQNKQELQLALDYDLGINDQSSNALHFGLEWSPISALALRTGLDNGDLCAGIGVMLDGFKFDYAYHTFNSVTQNSTNYFSFSYALGKKKVLNYLAIITPENQSIINQPNFALNGRILDPAVAKVLVAGKETSINKDKTFTAKIGLQIGKNSISLEALDQNGKSLQHLKLKILRLVSFNDVTENYWAKLPIEQLATLGTINGYTKDLYKPNSPIRRSEITALFVKAKGFDAVRITKPPFKDIPLQFWATQYIAAAMRDKTNPILTGYPDKTFKPNKVITRAEGAALLCRFANLAKKPVSNPPFPDISIKNWAAISISAAKDAGYFDYLAGFFDPNKKLTRGETAYVLSKTEYVAPQIKILMDFSIGY